MIIGDPIALPPDAAAAAKQYLRVERSDEDALLGGLMASASELCEAFTGQTLVAREFVETLPARAGWQRLGRTPVSAITAVEAVGADGGTTPLPSESYAIDIDSSGDGWVRLNAPATGRVRVRYRAGLAQEWAQLPAAIRQGAVRLAAHLYSHRTDESGRVSKEPPAAVTALWSPFRRIRLS